MLKSKKQENNSPAFTFKKYSDVEIKKAIEEMDKFKIKGKWGLRSEMNWLKYKGAIKIINSEHCTYSVIIPNYPLIRNLQEQVAEYERRQGYRQKKEVEELEELAKSMKIND